MIMLIACFGIGLLLGLIGLRLIDLWGVSHPNPPQTGSMRRHHS